jgi:methionyl-tRNA synthetase
MSTYITVAIPYVNAAPHLGYAFELVEADLVARARRALGDPVRFLGGTDDHSLKNVLAAEAAGAPTGAFVAEQGARFAHLAGPLGLTFDDFVRTGSDQRHRPAVERLWRACAERGDLVRRAYEGLYCVGCEQFFDAVELTDGRCPDHGTPAERVSESNWFFRLSRYQQQLLDLIERDELLIEPSPFRAEVLAFVRSGLRDISVSRSVARARGWGIGVPDDPTQVISVWFDALTNYISGLGYGSGSPDYDTWWRASDDRIHVVGKGILRFHAVYWPAFLLSAGEPLPTRVHVHPYLTTGGAKLSKSSGGGVSPTEVVAEHGTDALRWWFARDVSATADTDVTVDRLVARADEDLANGLGNAVNRITGLAHRYRDGRILDTGARPLEGAVDLPVRVARALAAFDRRGATALIVDLVSRLNREIEATAPWQLAKHPDSAHLFDQLIDRFAGTLRCLGEAIAPVTPELSARIGAALEGGAPEPVFPRRGTGRVVSDTPTARVT